MVALVVVLLTSAPGLGGSGPVAPTRAPGPWSTFTSAPFAANATALIGAASWNCGQGDQTIDLFARATSGVAPYRYLWSFGDGTPTSSEQDPVHTYQNVLGFTANLTITDATNATAHASVSQDWAIPLDCSTPPTTNWAGIALYVALLGGVGVGIALAVRGRRRQLPP